MTSISSSKDLIIKEFTSSKQIKFFKSLTKARVTGKLTFVNQQKKQEWHFYLYLGQIMYATGGEHPFRRWQRHLKLYVPQKPFNLIALESELGDRIEEFGSSLWEYQKLHSLLQNNEINRQQASNFIWSIVSEVLFDVTQAREVVCILEKNPNLNALLDLIDPLQVIEYTDLIWQDWQKEKIADRSPNLAPVILQAKQLREKIADNIYQNISQLLDNQKTLRDLAIHINASASEVTRSLLPYIQLGVLDLVAIPDLWSKSRLKPVVSPLSNGEPLIACIDDSMMASYTMEQIISVAGYRFLGINDPLDALAQLIERKPSLVFLDIVMPQMNGYELCTRIRNNPIVGDIPIVFLTSSDGIIDRLRAKMCGATDFMAKTVDAERVLEKIVKYLPSSQNE